MNDEPEIEHAWGWYDASTNELKHVSFNENYETGSALDRIPVEYATAVDILEGRSKLLEYYIGTDGAGKPSVIYKKRTPAFKKFWQLIDPEVPVFSGKFVSSDEQSSPVVIRGRNDRGFTVDVLGKAKNIVFYITMRNDPNYLIKRIELYPHAVAIGQTDSIPVSVDFDGDYSIYVRYDAA